MNVGVIILHIFEYIIYPVDTKKYHNICKNKSCLQPCLLHPLAISFALVIADYKVKFASTELKHDFLEHVFKKIWKNDVNITIHGCSYIQT